MVGKAVLEAGLDFRLLHCGPSPVSINTEKSGIHEGIPFEYMTSVKRPENRFARLLVFMLAALGVTRRLLQLWPERRSVVIYLYIMDGPMNLYVGGLCRLIGLPVAQELCEWLPGEPTCSGFTRWLYKKAMFKMATGVLVISRAIDERVRERSKAVGTQVLVHRVPAIVDPQRFATAGDVVANWDRKTPSFVYCGTWLKDIYFLVEALSLVKLQGHQCKLRIVGGFGEQSSVAILDYAMKHGLSSEHISFTGCVDEAKLGASYRAGIALLMPLWNDDRSITRLPNKLGEYLASGRPVISCKIGDLTEILTDNVNAYVGAPGNSGDFAAKMIAVLENPDRAREIGKAGQKACMKYLDYRAHVGGLADFFVQCVEIFRKRRLAI
jgi:glycosyltransferase involved in cell wall biosynthesis